MANPLTKSIINNLAKKYKEDKESKKEENSTKNLGEKEKAILEDILNKNAVRKKIATISNSNEKKKENSKQENKKLTSLKDLANKGGKS